MVIEVPTDAPRVSLRHLDDDGRAIDLVGHIVASDRTRLVIQPDTKPAVWLDRSRVHHLKRVPERVVLPNSSPDALQRMLDKTWPGLRRARLGGWVLRDSNGCTSRANSILVGGDPGMGWREAVALADEWRGQPSVLQVVLGDPIIAQAERAGYRLVGPTVLMVARSDDIPYGHKDIDIADEPDEGWLSIWRGGRADSRLVEELTATPALYGQIPGVAVGRVTVNALWAVISSVEVVPRMRGAGWGRAVMRALLDSVESRFVALQLGRENQVARTAYHREGFEEHHTYAYMFPQNTP